jgi:hypothetical protein
MFTKILRGSGVMFISLLTIILFSFTVSCKESLTDAHHLPIQASPNGYTMTMHEYIMNEFMSRFDIEGFHDLLGNDAFFQSVTDTTNVYEIIKYFADNIELFLDSSLFDEILIEAGSKYNYAIEPDMLNLFSKDKVKLYIDYDKVYGGVNLLQPHSALLRDEMQVRYEGNIKPNLNPVDRQHYEALLTLMYDGSSLDKIAFLNIPATGIHSPLYKEFLAFAMNNYRFYHTEFKQYTKPVDKDINGYFESIANCNACQTGRPSPCPRANSHKRMAAHASGYGLISFWFWQSFGTSWY